MVEKKFSKTILLVLLVISVILAFSLIATQHIAQTTNMDNSKIDTIDDSLNNRKLSNVNYANATVISDGYNDIWDWNDDHSNFPDIATDSSGNLHVVWADDTDNPSKWGSDGEVMYANYTVATDQWSNITVLSDGYGGDWGWNSENSNNPSIAIDNQDNIHVVWDDNTPGKWRYDVSDNEIMYVNYSVATGQWSNVTILSDGYQGIYWNKGESSQASIVADKLNNLFVIWHDDTDNPAKWGTDFEIMCVNFSIATGKWSNVTILSDGYNNQWNWNTGNSYHPEIVTDGSGNVHLVWYDNTPGKWRYDIDDNEIMYANYSVASGKWSNATVISDGYNNQWGWNFGNSLMPDITTDGSGNIHVVWEDYTSNPSKWGLDVEIMYAKWTAATGWSNASVISDGYNNQWGWNINSSMYADIAADGLGNVHVVWIDYTSNPSKWGSDAEIMYANYSIGSGKWSNATVISDGYNNTWGWNTGISWYPDIVTDRLGDVHVVWTDDTANPSKWGTDREIMYTKIVASKGFNLTWGVNSNDVGHDIAVDNSGNIYITGHTGNDAFIAKFDSSGNSVLNITYGGASDDQGMAITIDSSDNVYIAGYTQSYGAGGWDAFLAKYNSSGVLLWNHTWGGGVTDLGYGVAVDPSSDCVYLMGDTYSFALGDNDMFLVKYNSSGTQLWNQTWGGINSDLGEGGIAVDPSSGNVYIAGYTDSFTVGGSDASLVKYNSLGIQLWNRTWGGGLFEKGLGVAVDSSSNSVYLTGISNGFGAGGTDAFLAKYNSSGTQLWNHTWGGGGEEYGYDVVFDPSSSSVYIVGQTDSFGVGGNDAYIARFDGSGNSVLNITWGGGNDDRGYGITLDIYGNIYITGYTNSFGAAGSNAFIAKYVNAGYLNLSPSANHPNSVITSINGVETINWILYDESGGGMYRVIANNTNGAYYVWRDWRSWSNNVPLNVEINHTSVGIYNYTIEYYDNQNKFGAPDTVIITITQQQTTPSPIGADDDSDGGTDSTEKPQDYTLLIIGIVTIAAIGVITFIVVKKIKSGPEIERTEESKKISIEKQEVGPIEEQEVGPIEEQEVIPIEEQEVGPIEEQEVGPIEISKINKELQPISETSTIIEKETRKEKKAKDRLKKLEGLIKISKKIKLETMRKALNLSEKEFMNKIVEWGDYYNLTIDGDYLIINKDTDISNFMADLDKQYKEWEKRPGDKIEEIKKAEIFKTSTTPIPIKISEQTIFEMGYKVFICHSSKDKVIADTICQFLEKNNIKCWIAPRDPIVGIPYAKSITMAIAGTKLMILVLTKNSNNSEQVTLELENAVNRKKVIITFRTENIEPDDVIGYYIKKVHWLDAWTLPLEEHLKELVKIVKMHLV